MARSTDEARRWCSVEEHPFPSDRVRRWWAEAGVLPFLLIDEADATSVGYGEVWVDQEEDEVELARLIIDPARRRSAEWNQGQPTSYVWFEWPGSIRTDPVAGKG